jgi:hypothetical protein
MTHPRTAIVIAALDFGRTVRASLDGFLAETLGGDEVVIVTSSRDDTPRIAHAPTSRVRVLHQPYGRLVPELWSEGLKRTGASFVAFTTAQMVPRPGWLRTLHEGLEATGAAGVGGAIAPGAGLSATDRALYLMRYASYLPPVPSSRSFEPPGDNALYRAESLREVEATWQSAFWEVEVHRALRSRGATVACAPEAVVTFEGGTRLGSALLHRLAHAYQYGRGRVRGLGWAHRLARASAFPAVPPLLLARIAGTLQRRGEPFGPWLGTLPQLLVLLSTWSLGEAAGAFWGPGSDSKSDLSRAHDQYSLSCRPD